MSKTFRFYAVREFPDDLDDRPYLIPNQVSLGDIDAQDTVLRHVGALCGPYGDLELVQISHDVLVETAGRAIMRTAGGPTVEEFSEYVTTHHLNGFLAEARGLFVIEGKGQIVSQAFRSLRDNADRVCIAEQQVQFDRVSSLVGRFKGAWFSKSAGPVSSLGLYGQDVSGSAEWEDATLNASISNVMFQHMHRGAWHTVTITRDAGVVVYQDASLNEMLDVAFSVYDVLIEPSVDEPDFSANRARPKRGGLQ